MQRRGNRECSTASMVFAIRCVTTQTKVREGQFSPRGNLGGGHFARKDRNAESSAMDNTIGRMERVIRYTDPNLWLGSHLYAVKEITRS